MAYNEVNEPQSQYQSEPKPQRVSLEDYLEMIADGERRLEYHDGQVVDIQSATEQHGKICTNLTFEISTCQRRSETCDVYAGDRELWVAECNKMFYPDHLIVCGEHRFKQMSKNVKATINPSVVIEVLSDSTEEFDQTKKARCYKTLKSLKQIVFVSQEEKYVRTIIKTENERIWNEMEFFEDDEKVPIGDCEILLKDIYRRVNFENAPQNASDTEGV